MTDTGDNPDNPANPDNPDNPANTTAALLRLGAATLGESGGHTTSARLKPAWAGARLAAPVFTVCLGPGDNLAVHVATARAPAGSALVVEAAGPDELGYWGEVLTTAAEARGLAGLVIDACVRDVAALAHHRFPVFSTGVALPGASKRGGGSVGRPVEVAGAPVRAGDWVVGDEDGVVFVPRASLTEVLAAGELRAGREASYFESLRGGSTTLDLLGVDPSTVDGA